jgi:hypothetical protein
MSLIGDARDRAKAFARRKAGLVKKAQQLAKLCDVDVALVVCVGPISGALVVWESDPGVVNDGEGRCCFLSPARAVALFFLLVRRLSTAMAAAAQQSSTARS